MTKVSSKVVPLSYNDWGSARELVIIHRSIPSSYGISDLREALSDISERWDDQHYLPKPYGAFDCDGSTFTEHSEAISKKIVGGVGGLLVEVIIEHHTSANI